MSVTSAHTPDRVVADHDAAPTGKLAESYSQFVAGEEGSYKEDLARSRRRIRIAKYAVSGSLWALAAIPLAREIASGGGAGAVLAYLGVAAVSLGIAAALRWVYVLLTRASPVSASVFLIAALLAIVSYGVQSAGVPQPQPSDTTAAPEVRQTL